MRFGAHVSSSGGISKAIGRGVNLGCESLQVFTHNPRTWRPIKHTDEEIAAFRRRRRRRRHGAAREPRPLPDQPRRARRRGAHRAARRAGGGHAQHLPLVGREPGAAPRASAPRWASSASSCTSARSRDRPRPSRSRGSAPASPRRSRPPTATAASTSRTRPAPATPSAAPSGSCAPWPTPSACPKRLAFCLDSQHLFASGYPVHEEGGIDRVLAEFDDVAGHGPAALPAPQRLQGRLRLEPRPPREHRRRRDRRGGHAAHPRVAPTCRASRSSWRSRDRGSGVDPENMARARRLHEEGLAARAG